MPTMPSSDGGVAWHILSLSRTMRRIFLFWKSRPQQAAEPWRLSPDQHREVVGLLSRIGLQIVAETRGPVTLMKFARRFLDELDADRRLFAVPLPEFADALKRAIREMNQESLRVMSPTDFVGVGYVYNALDPDTVPVRSNR